jgi:hypothetical protein
MDEGDGNRSLADRRRDSFDVATSHVADSKDTGQARFEEMRRPGQRPVRGRQIVARQVGPGLDESLGIERNTAIEPDRVRYGPS